MNTAASQETLAQEIDISAPSTPLTAHNSGLTAPGWYGDMSTTIGDTRKVTGQLAGQITVRADTLKADSNRSLLLTTIVMLLLLVLLISAMLARPPRKQHADTLIAVTR